MKEEHQIKHLEMVQEAIARMARNSFIIKGWNITLASGLAALAVKDASGLPGAVAIIGLDPAIAFWALDAYYLRLERLYRKLHDAVALPLNEPGKEGPDLFSMDVRAFEPEVGNWLVIALTRSVLLVHGPLVLCLATVAVCMGTS